MLSDVLGYSFLAFADIFLPHPQAKHSSEACQANFFMLHFASIAQNIECKKLLFELVDH